MEKFKGFFIRRQIRICQKSAYTKNIAKGTTDPRVEFVSQDHSSQFTNIEHITISESRFNFVTSSKHQLQNTDQTSAPKSCLNFNFKILTKVLKV